MIEKIRKTEEEWKKILTPEQYRVMREEGTEVPGSCALTQNKGTGTYHCAACDLPLFQSGTKFESASMPGWPAFFNPVSEENIIYKDDRSFGMKRTEIQCARCESHLGHVFNDGPPPTHKHYCVNGVALNFKPQKNGKK